MNNLTHDSDTYLCQCTVGVCPRSRKAEGDRKIDTPIRVACRALLERVMETALDESSNSLSDLRVDHYLHDSRTPSGLYYLRSVPIAPPM
jgi:hypothetical protein